MTIGDILAPLLDRFREPNRFSVSKPGDAPNATAWQHQLRKLDEREPREWGEFRRHLIDSGMVRTRNASRVGDEMPETIRAEIARAMQRAPEPPWPSDGVEQAGDPYEHCSKPMEPPCPLPKGHTGKCARGLEPYRRLAVAQTMG